jgi:hypothetical protein
VDPALEGTEAHSRTAELKALEQLAARYEIVEAAREFASPGYRRLPEREIGINGSHRATVPEHGESRNAGMSQAPFSNCRIGPFETAANDLLTMSFW